MKRRFGDRKDGYRLRKADPFFRVIPYLMKNRSGAQVFFKDRVYLKEIDILIKQLRDEGHKLGFLHIVIASMVRTMSQRPKINRFVAGRKIYARKEISFSITIKKDMSDDSEETTIKIIFEPTDTIYDVIEKINLQINNNKNVNTDNSTDKAAKVFSILPGFLLNWSLNFVRFLDFYGRVPKFLTDLSPFHSSVYLTDLGSLGIKGAYHHLFDIGTNTVFIAFGTKTKEQYIDSDNNVTIRKSMDLRIVADERVVDGYYFAKSIKLAKRIMENPRQLLLPPKEVI